MDVRDLIGLKPILSMLRGVLRADGAALGTISCERNSGLIVSSAGLRMVLPFRRRSRERRASGLNLKLFKCCDFLPMNGGWTLAPCETAFRKEVSC